MISERKKKKAHILEYIQKQLTHYKSIRKTDRNTEDEAAIKLYTWFNGVISRTKLKDIDFYNCYE